MNMNQKADTLTGKLWGPRKDQPRRLTGTMVRTRQGRVGKQAGPDRLGFVVADLTSDANDGAFATVSHALVFATRLRDTSSRREPGKKRKTKTTSTNSPNALRINYGPAKTFLRLTQAVEYVLRDLLTAEQDPAEQAKLTRLRNQLSPAGATLPGWLYELAVDLENKAERTGVAVFQFKNPEPLANWLNKGHGGCTPPSYPTSPATCRLILTPLDPDPDNPIGSAVTLTDAVRPIILRHIQREAMIRTARIEGGGPTKAPPSVRVIQSESGIEFPIDVAPLPDQPPTDPSEAFRRRMLGAVRSIVKDETAKALDQVKAFHSRVDQLNENLAKIERRLSDLFDDNAATLRLLADLEADIEARKARAITRNQTDTPNHAANSQDRSPN